VQTAPISIDGTTLDRLWSTVTAQNQDPSSIQGWQDDDFEIPSYLTQSKSSLNNSINYVSSIGRKVINEFHYWVFTNPPKRSPQTTIQPTDIAATTTLMTACMRNSLLTRSVPLVIVLSHAVPATIVFYNMSGEKILSLSAGANGTRKIVWNGLLSGGKRTPAGTYICKVILADNMITRRVTIMP
jgi:hypothetical protein